MRDVRLSTDTGGGPPPVVSDTRSCDGVGAAGLALPLGAFVLHGAAEYAGESSFALGVRFER